jgi:putative membrane protein
LITAIVAATFTAAAAAQTPSPEPTRPPAARADQASKRDAPAAPGAAERKFMFDAALGGMAEVEGGQLAAKKATADAVRSFGQRMVKDHGQANAELRRIAGAKGVPLPTQLDHKHRSELTRLEKLSGPAFDRAYMQHMVQDHEKDVAAFRQAAKDLNDPEVKQFAAASLPTLEEHLRMAQQTTASANGRTSQR